MFLNVFLAALFVLALAGLIIFVNRTFPPGNRLKVLQRPHDLPDRLSDTVILTTWNIGYAGLGKESDFVTDGGKNWFPPSRNTVRTNLKAIVHTLSHDPADIILLQEVSDSSPLSLWVPVRRPILEALAQRMALFRPDISTALLPWPFRICHGTMTLTGAAPASGQVVPLPAEPTWLGGVIKRNYALLVTRFAIAGSSAQWVIVNLHLAAFDPKGATRFRQFERVLAFAQKEYEKGNHVVLGGDWNLALTKTSFPHQTDLDRLFWLVDLPEELLPPSWNIACDTATPTVRTNYQPYVAGQNYAGIIDGFITSPNVRINTVRTRNLQFEHTDHHPVSGSFSTRPPPRG